jgi:UDP-2-acetamido-3-amino-2,3-dideoxy-glucuronate N-acetyltransferase
MIHATAEVHSKFIGEGTNIWQNCVILEKAKIGDNCNINFNVFIENEVIIGNDVTIKSGVQLWDGLYIEDNVFVGPNVTFTNDSSPRSKQYPEKFLEIRIMKGASIGANSTILGGVSIGKFSMIGAGSVVTKNIADHTLWYGNPAKFKAYICECGRKINEDLICTFCDKKYAMNMGNLGRI